MRAKYLQPAELIIPVSLLAFVGPGISYINGILNGTTRWAILAALTLFLLTCRWREGFSLLGSPLFSIVTISAFWGLLTVAWSEVPQISFAKALAFFWVSVTMLIAGYSWVARHTRPQTYDFIWLFVVSSLLVTLGGESVENQNMDSALYMGLAGNPNLLGFLLAVSGAWLIWRSYLTRWNNNRVFFLYSGLLAFDLYFLYLSHSRASQLIFLVVVVGFLIGLRKVRKFLPYAIISTGLFVATYNIFPTVRDSVVQYAFKTNLEYLSEIDVENAILFSREVLWQESYDLAMRGGLVGGGYGVTIGEPFQGEIGSTISTGQYGREQGNSQLAIIEQTGLIGFAIYLTLIASIGWVLVSGLRCARDGADRVAIGLMGGTLFGMLVMSVFEAWWVAPGSVESATFWMILGALLGTIRRARLDALQHRAHAELAPAGVSA